MRPLALLALGLAGCSTPLAQLRVELGPRASEVMTCPEGELRYQELDRLISSTKVRVSGCGKESTWKLVESRWQKVTNHPVAP